MKILIDAYDDHSNIKYEKILDVEADDIAQQIIDVLALAVKKDCKKIVMHLHER